MKQNFSTIDPAKLREIVCKRVEAVRANAKPRFCSVEGCGKRHERRGFCEAHVRRFVRYGDPLGGPTVRGSTAEFVRFALTYEGDECLIWPFSRKQGYAASTKDGSVTRLICQVTRGEPPTESHEAAHSCGKGHLGCIAKRHLRWATPKENGQDRITHGTVPKKGVAIPRTLTVDDVIAIRALAESHTISEMSRQFRTNRSTIRKVVNRKTWAHIQ